MIKVNNYYLSTFLVNKRNETTTNNNKKKKINLFDLQTFLITLKNKLLMTYKKSYLKELLASLLRL